MHSQNLNIHTRVVSNDIVELLTPFILFTTAIKIFLGLRATDGIIYTQSDDGAQSFKY